MGFLRLMQGFWCGTGLRRKLGLMRRVLSGFNGGLEHEVLGFSLFTGLGFSFWHLVILGFCSGSMRFVWSLVLRTNS